MAHQAREKDRWSSLFPLHELASHPFEWAVFCDIDGTLIDLAEIPATIVVPHGLPADLELLSHNLGGALALVTGRSVAFVETLFATSQFPVAGLHGAEWRHPQGPLQSVSVSSEFDALKSVIVNEARQWPGVLVEDKGAAIAGSLPTLAATPARC